MRKRLALVLLAPECSSWPPVAAGTALPAWFGAPPVFAPWMAAGVLTETWLCMLRELLAWIFSPRIREKPAETATF